MKATQVINVLEVPCLNSSIEILRLRFVNRQEKHDGI